MTASVHTLPRRDYDARAMTQEELDVETVRAAQGTHDELIVLAAAQRLKRSRDWMNADLGRAVEAAIFSAAMSDDLPERREPWQRFFARFGDALGVAILFGLLWAGLIFGGVW